MSALEASSLLEAAHNGDNEACERMLEENAGLIWSIVRRYYGRGVDPEDLYQLGCLGFLKAVRGFDTAYGCQFSTYAVPKIAGEIRRFLRDDGAVKVSRGVKERGTAIRTARDRLTHLLGREPTLSELSEETGLEPEEIAAAEEANLPVASLQMETGDGGFTLESVLGTEGMEEGVVEKIFAIPGVGSLLVTAIQSNDYNVVIGLSFIYSAMYIGIMLVVDLLYGIIDPRIRLAKGDD